ncbi:multicopper oxidase family protein [Niveispirillum cyanobacteriorum]|uniref:Copper oxidase n=1 Tax=Niveispirillum cyanobacteriorum TaxID=1612173 RepID=A0A2K9N913_9PROT|nr:multicopper oxidase domain-containing protein [Niveispirillum cyanobacteriorum]AUN29574.1 copper oxidase [Niveispirillum cyanobacteriorum]GGE63056.1 L-ascorbate oxidase [Niveispirillum cyanobacteriorum]
MRTALKAGVAALCLAVAGPVMAAELVNPPDMRRNAAGQYDLEAVTAEYRLPPFTQRITSRSFISKGTGKWDETRKLLVGPTLRAAPGETVRIRMTNHMKASAGDGDYYPFSNSHDSGTPAADSTNVDTLPHGFDILNLHTHGLHVTPLGNSDNVLLNILPEGATAADLRKACHSETDKNVAHRHVCVEGAFDYEYKIPEQHPAGTFWYHPHKHGAVAMHLGSGMAGALIIEDKKNGIDSLPAVKQAKALNGERILVFQQIEFTRSNPLTEAEPLYAVNCQAAYGPAVCGQLGNTSLENSAVNAKLSVNGQMDATITMAPGEAMLWRVINTTIRNNLPLCVLPLPGTSAPAPTLYALAADGVPIKRPMPAGTQDLPFKLGAPVYDLSTPTAGTDVINNELTIMAPGQRLDVMVQAPNAEGRYALFQPNPNNAPTATTGLCQVPQLDSNNRLPPDQVVLYIDVKKHKRKVNTTLPTQTQLNALYTPDDVASRTDVPVGPTQGVVFGFTNYEFAPTALQGASVVNGRPFNLERVQRRLKLEQTDRWAVQSASDTHIFHIHINSFQITQRGSVKYDFPIWRDTALINCATGPGIGGCTFPAGNTIQQPGAAAGGSGNGEVLQFVSRALDFTGPMVMHCHNVNHEDNGMMELIELVK